MAIRWSSCSAGGKKEESAEGSSPHAVMVEIVLNREEDQIYDVSHLYDALRRNNLERPGRILENGT